MVMKAGLIKMIKNPRDEDLPPKELEASAATSSGLWSGLKNPRIVRVSRAFGGKDRHSKVSTIRGLRDRRIRLSVQTAIQLYDLQDRLGLNQPSKVVDWLLNAAREEIDKLPPLQIPTSGQIPQSLPQSLPIENFKYTNDNTEGLTTFPPQSTYWQRSSEAQEDEQSQKINIVNKAPPYSPYYHWEAPSNAYLYQLGNRSYQPDQGPHMSQAPESQIVLYPPGVVPSMFPSYVQMQMALQTPQSNDSSDPLHLGTGPSVSRHFQ